MSGRKLAPGWSRTVPGVVCEREDDHTPSPDRYLDWHEWAPKKGKTHKQIRCAGCDRLAIWVPKE